MFKLNSLSFEHLFGMIKNGEHFTFSRHKDGEFYAIFNHLNIHEKRIRNCDGHLYYKDMGKRLLETLTNPRDYIHGIQPLVHRKMYKPVDMLFDDYDINIKWYESDMFHHALRDGLLYPFIEQLRKMDVVIVGADRIKPIKKYLNKVEFVSVPVKNCWLEVDRIKADVLKTMESNKIYLFSSSMPTAVMIYDLYPFIGDNWMIDFGSIWEGVLGMPIRNYQRGLTEDIRKKNINETV